MVRLADSAGGQATSSRQQCGSGGWPEPHSFCRTSYQPSAISHQVLVSKHHLHIRKRFGLVIQKHVWFLTISAQNSFERVFFFERMSNTIHLTGMSAESEGNRTSRFV